MTEQQKPNIIPVDIKDVLPVMPYKDGRMAPKDSIIFTWYKGMPCLAAYITGEGWRVLLNHENEELRVHKAYRPFEPKVFVLVTKPELKPAEIVPIPEKAPEQDKPVAQEGQG